MARTHTDYRVTFVVLATAALAFSLLQSLIIPAIPQLEHTLHTSESGASWLLTAYLLSATIATPILGRVGDMIGKEKRHRRRPDRALGRVADQRLGDDVAGDAGRPRRFRARPVRCSRSPSASSATSSRGAGGGAIGVMSAILGAGAGAGIVLAGPILGAPQLPLAVLDPADHVGRRDHRHVRLRAGVAGAIPGTHQLARGRPDVGLAGDRTARHFLCATWGWGSTSVIVLGAVTAVLVVVWVISENRSSSPLVDMKMMRIPAVWSTNLAALLFGFGMFAMFIVLPQFTQTPTHVGYGFGASVTQSGLYLRLSPWPW